MSGRNSREARRQALVEARQAQQRRRRRLRLAGWIGAAVVLAGAGIGVGLGVSGAGAGSGPGAGAVAGPGNGDSNGSGNSQDTASEPLSSLGPLQPPPAPGPTGPENVPVPAAAPLAGISASTTGQAIDQISCSTAEQTVFHIHTHLTIFVNGQPRQVPEAIGIPNPQAQQAPGGTFVDSGSCFYWLHTHAADGIIHIESPVQRTFTLGEFFDEWGQPLVPDQAGPARGKVTVLVNGKVFTGDPRSVPLGSHENLQVEVGTPLIAPETIDWAPTGL